MADEVTLSFTTKLANTNITDNYSSGSISIDQASEKFLVNTQSIGTSAENLEKGSITTPGLVVVKNLDATNFVEIGVDSGGFVATIKVLPGDQAVFYSASATLQAKADTASVELLYRIYEA